MSFKNFLMLLSSFSGGPKEDFDANAKKHNIIIPALVKPAGNYKPYQISGNLLYVSQVAFKDGKIMFPGKLTSDVSLEQGQEAAKQTMLNILAAVKDACHGTLNGVSKIVRLDGYIASSADFYEHPKVLDAASNLLVTIFGEKGIHARASLGAISLPLNSPVEISAIVELKTRHFCNGSHRMK